MLTTGLIIVALTLSIIIIQIKMAVLIMREHPTRIHQEVQNSKVREEAIASSLISRWARDSPCRTMMPIIITIIAIMEIDGKGEVIYPSQSFMREITASSFTGQMS